MHQLDTLLYIIGRKWWATAVLLLLHTTLQAAAREELLMSFTSDAPLVVVTTNNNPPYEYEVGGKPGGYNVELIRRITEVLGVPCKVMSMSWREAVKMFEEGQAHLIMTSDDMHFNHSPVMGKSNLAPVYVALAYKTGQYDITAITDIPASATIYSLHRGPIFLKAVDSGLDTANVEIIDASYQLDVIDNSDNAILLGNEMQLAKVMREKQRSDITVSRLSLQASFVRFCSYNAVLVNLMDEEFARLEQRGEIEAMQTNWFYPDRKGGFVWSSLALPFIVVSMVVLLLLLAVNRIIVARTYHSARRLRKARNMMQSAIRLDGRDVICFDFKDGLVKNVSGHFLPDSGLIPEQYLLHVHPDDRPLVYGHMKHMDTDNLGEVFNSPVYRWSEEVNSDGPWRMVILQSVFEKTEGGSHVEVVSTVSDITDEMSRSQEEETTSEMFHKIFDNAVLGMAIYSPSGEMLNGNRRMYEIFHIPTDRAPGQGGYFYGNNLFKMPSLVGVLDPVNPQKLWICTHIHSGGWQELSYIELHITPVYDDSHKLIFLLVSVRDITDDVKTCRQNQAEQERLRLADEQLRQREEELSILMKTSRMRLWTLSNHDHTISFFHSPTIPERVMTWVEFLDHAADDDSREKMLRLLQQDPEVMKEAKVYAAMNNLLGEYDTVQWYALSVLGHNTPDEYGEEQLFGLALNITASIEAQRTFETEKQRATESEHQKTIFLNSMTHEIRTPLNSIVGFSEVLPMLEGEERELIIDTIKQNCDKLLRLTDDILTISAMDAKELKFEYKDIDFAKAFDEEFEHLRIYTDQNSNVGYLKDNPFETLMVRIDMKRISQILTNFLGNAVKYTTEGFIKLGYSCDNHFLRIYCQDTGVGISKDRQKFVFERFFQVDSFVQGTGMGLSVCKAITDAMGGVIGVESEEGVGSTFYVEIPVKGGGKIAVGV